MSGYGGNAALAGGTTIFLIALIYALRSSAPEPQPAEEPQPAATPGSGTAFAPYVFIDRETGCEYLSTHLSTGLVPRVAADGMTQKGCTGVER